MECNIKFVFVILHYSAVNDTIECVESILENLDDPNFEIVVVDNCSPDDDLSILKEKFAKSKLHFIQNEENLGFAKGNNVGYQYAKKELNANFIILLNNDTTVEQNDFLTRISNIYDETQFAVLGPDILSTADGEHQNPHIKVNLQKIRTNIIFYKLCLILTYINLYEPITKSILCLSKTLGCKQKSNDEHWKQSKEGTKLQGSCLVFSPVYVQKYRGLFDKTFMYVEEDILFYIAKQENLKMVYSPDIQILHKEKSSTKSLNDTSKKMKIFYYKNMCSSLKEFLALTKNYAQEHEKMLDDV